MALARLKKRSEFLRVAQAKIVAKTPTMVIQCCLAQAATDQNSEVKVGFTASRRVGNAIKRNRAKRRLRALVDKGLSQKISEVLGHTYLPCDLVFIAVPMTVTADSQQLAKDFSVGVKRCLTQLKPSPALVFEETEEEPL